MKPEFNDPIFRLHPQKHECPGSRHIVEDLTRNALPMLLASLVALIHFMGIQSVHGAEQGSNNQVLAQPGFLEIESKAGGYHLGFRSSAYLTDPGIWGVLCLTAEQGEALKVALAETITVANSDPSMDGAEKQQRQNEFNRRRDEILTSEQKDILREVNRIFRELEERQKQEGGSRTEMPWEQLKATLPVPNLTNLENTLGQAP